LREFVRICGPKPGKQAPSQISIAHPLLSMFDLHAFVVDDITLPKKTGPGIFDVTMKVVQWFPQPTPSPKKATGGSITEVKVAQALKAPAVPAPPSATKAKP